MATTLRDVATAAGVHPGTASRAMNPETEHLVNPATARRIIKVAHSLGYVANPLARGLKTNRTLSLGFIVPDITNPLFPPMIRGFEDVVSEQGYSAITANTDNDPERQRQQIAAMRSRRIDGLALATAVLDHGADEQDAVAGIPAVHVNRVDPTQHLSSVASDDQSGIRQAVAHLRALGHRRVAHIAGPQGTSTGVARSRAFRHEMRDAGLDADERLILSAQHYTIEQGTELTNALLEQGEDFTAVVAANDLLALGCCDALFARGLRCPEDVSVVGFNDMPFVDRVSPALTTVHVPHYELGAEAGRSLLSQIAAPDRKATSVLLPVTLVVRGSTAPPH
ncbi:MAG: LacI family DNA-binding transcriptional regulator [Microbacterium sp.]